MNRFIIRHQNTICILIAFAALQVIGWHHIITG